MLLNLALLVLLAGESASLKIVDLGCNDTAYVKPGDYAYFRSPNFDGHTHYNNSENCSVVLTTQEHPLTYILHATHFNVEHQEICRYDSLCIKGVKFCGTWLFGRDFHFDVPPYNQLTLSFTTDTSETKPGFEFKIQTYYASHLKPGDHIRQIAWGVGSEEAKLGYSFITLDKYEDTKCGSQPLGRPDYYYGGTIDNYGTTEDHTTTEDCDQGTTDDHTTTDSYSTRDWVTRGYPYNQHYYTQTTQDYDYSTRDWTTGGYPYHQYYYGRTTQDYDCPCRCGTTYNPYYGWGRYGYGTTDRYGTTDYYGRYGYGTTDRDGSTDYYGPYRYGTTDSYGTTDYYGRYGYGTTDRYRTTYSYGK